MHLDIRAIDLANSQHQIRLTSVPDECPRCLRGIHPKCVYSAALVERHLCQVIYRCTRQDCQELFVATYVDKLKDTAGGREYYLIRIAPMAPCQAPFSQTIEDLSPAFIEIYNQAMSAESHELGQLVGVGLRKALEFLVKDFSCSQNPGSEAEIRSTFLGTCITNYIDDVNIKECAKRAAWLGNDETHYTRRWEDRDIKDLKLLVTLTVNWIENVLLTQKYISDMSDSPT